jgi:hypothetical protein
LARETTVVEPQKLDLFSSIICFFISYPIQPKSYLSTLYFGAFNLVEVCKLIHELNMKKAYSTPELNVHGSIEELTQVTKYLGKDDGVILVIPGLTPDGGVPIGS